GDVKRGGHADILLQDNNRTNEWDAADGQAAIWLINGTTPTAEPIIANPGPNWHVITAGDFNGDGHADILWQYNNTANASDPGNEIARTWCREGTKPTGGPVAAKHRPRRHVITDRRCN